MQLSHTGASLSASLDEPHLVSAAGLVPVMGPALEAGLRDLADDWLSVPTDKGANAGLKVASLVAGMVAGADSIDDMALLRHGGMDRLFKACYAPSTLGSFLRSFTSTDHSVATSSFSSSIATGNDSADHSTRTTSPTPRQSPRSNGSPAGTSGSSSGSSPRSPVY